LLIVLFIQLINTYYKIYSKFRSTTIKTLGKDAVSFKDEKGKKTKTQKKNNFKTATIILKYPSIN